MSRSLKEDSAGRTGTDFWGAASTRDATRSFDPLAHFRSILQHKWPILAVTLVAAALAIVYTVTATPLYQSTQSLLLENTDTNIVAVEELVETDSAEDGYVQTQIELLHSRELAERTIDSLGLLAEPVFVNGVAQRAGLDPARLGVAPADTAADSGSAVDGTVQEPLSMIQRRALAVDFLHAGLSVTAVPTTRLLHINFLSADPDLAANIANEIGLQYILNHVESTRDLVDEVSGWLDGRLAELKDDLDGSERRLLDFKRENGLIGVDGNMGTLGEQALLQSASELADARVRLSSIEDQLEDLRGETSIEGRLARLRTDAEIQRTHVELLRVTQENQRLSTQYGPRHPRRVELDSELQALRASLDQSVAQATVALENEGRLLSKQVESLEGRLADSRATVQDVDAKSIDLAVLQREVQTNRELYYRFFDRMVETRSTQGLESTNATVIEYAKPALAPAKPDKAFIVLLATLGTLACATLAALLVNVFDDSIQRLSDVEGRLGSRLLGVIPLYRRRRSRLARLLHFGGAAQEAKTGRMFNEAYNSLRANLQLQDRDGVRRVVLVTSSVPGEGKSMSSVCLSRAFASNERVLLIDADLRRPSIASALRLDAQAHGLTHVLSGRGNAADYIQQYKTGSFDVLTTGLRTDHPLELLFSTHFESMLAQLARRYDRIVIDCAPVEAVSDAFVLSRLADSVIYAVKAHDTSMGVVASGLQKLQAVDAPMAGVLLTQIDLSKLSAYGADYEFHGYFDYYDYAGEARGASLSLAPDELRSLGRRRAERPLEQSRRARTNDSGSLA